MKPIVLTTEDWETGSSRLAEHYEDVARWSKYTAPFTMVAAMAPYLRHRHSILDVGVGTGLVGAELAKNGLDLIVDGIDKSLSMVKKANEKQKYRQLLQSDITDASQPEFLRPQTHYDCIISVGLFGEHVSSDYVPKLHPAVAQHGFLAIASSVPLSTELAPKTWNILLDFRHRAYSNISMGDVSYHFVVARKR